MKSKDDLPTRQAMKKAHKVRRFRRGNISGEGRGYLGHKHKPWTPHNPERSAA